MKSGTPDPTLLQYDTATVPMPLQITADGTLIISIPVPSPAVYCQQIALTFYYGSDEICLTDNALGTSNLSVDPSAKWSVGDGDSDSSKGKTIVLNTKQSDYNLINYPITITVSGFTVNETLGIASIGITESSSVDGTNYTDKTKTLTLNKIPLNQFYVGNFVATLATDTKVVSEVEYNAKLMLSWEGSINNYEIIYDEGDPVPVSAGQYSWPVPAGLNHTTTFILRASQQIPASANGGPVGDPQTVYIYSALTVIVRNPDLVGSSLAVTGTGDIQGMLKLHDKLEVDGSSVLADVSISSGVTVKGLSSLQAVTIGTAQAPSDLTVYGGTTTDNGTVNQKLQVNGDTVLNNVTIQGNITIGNWTIKVDPQYNLSIMNNTNKKGVSINSDGTFFTSGPISVNGARVTCYEDPIHILCPSPTGGYLNGTSRFQIPANNWKSTAYWINVNSPDPDSNLVLKYGLPPF
jgi:hypothetical protein